MSAEVVRVPRGLPPQVGLAHAADIDGKILLTLTQTRFVSEQRTRVVEVDGKQVAETYTVTKPVLIQRQIALGGTAARVVDAKGKTVDPKSLIMRLREDTPIVVFRGKADPYYLQVLKGDTFVLELEPAPE